MSSPDSRALEVEHTSRHDVHMQSTKKDQICRRSKSGQVLRALCSRVRTINKERDEPKKKVVEKPNNGDPNNDLDYYSGDQDYYSDRDLNEYDLFVLIVRLSCKSKL
jgi:hypothetical protein